MQAIGIDQIVGRIIFKQYNIGHQSTTSLHAFKQIVAEQSIVRDTILQTLLERGQIIDALAYVVAFVEQVLVNIGYRARVQIDDRIAGIYARENRSICGGWSHLDPGWRTV